MNTAKETKKLSALELSIRTVKPRSATVEASDKQSPRVVVVTIY